MTLVDWFTHLKYSDDDLKRTITFSVLNRDWIPECHRRQYEEYGAIRSYRFLKLDDGHYQPLTHYIEFYDPQVVSYLLSRGYIYINDIKIKISPMLQPGENSLLELSYKSLSENILNLRHYECWRGIVRKLHLPSIRSVSNVCRRIAKQMFKTTENAVMEVHEKCLPENILIALNDDCLREIFRKLHFTTLHTVCNVCVRFNRIAKEIYQLKYKDNILQFCDLSDSPISLVHVENFLKNFGPSIEKLKIMEWEVSFNKTLLTDLLRMISKYCINIYDLNISTLCATDETIIELRPLFRRLKHLKLVVKHTQTFKAILLSCSQLKCITMNHVTEDECMPTEIELPKLLDLNIYLDHQTSKYLKNLKCNLQLKRIRIWAHRNYNAETTLDIQDICGKFPNICQLSVAINAWPDDNFAANLMHFARLKRLQRLTLNAYVGNVSPLLKEMLENNVELKYLRLQNYRIDDDEIDTISQMKTIEELRVGYELIFPCFLTRLNTYQLKRLVKQLPRLNELSLYKYPDSVEIVDTLLQIIPFAKQLTFLRILVSASDHELPVFNENICSELTKVIQKRENSKKLSITISSFIVAPLSDSQGNRVIVVNNEWLRVDINFCIISTSMLLGPIWWMGQVP